MAKLEKWENGQHPLHLHSETVFYNVIANAESNRGNVENFTLVCI